LVDLNSAPEFRGYSSGRDKDGADWIRADMIELAATQPLIRIDDSTVAFGTDNFFQKILAGESVEGNA